MTSSGTSPGPTAIAEMIAFARRHLASHELAGPAPQITQAGFQVLLDSLPTSRIPAWVRLDELCRDRIEAIVAGA